MTLMTVSNPLQGLEKGTPLMLSQFWPLFLLYLCGITLAIAAFAGENVAKANISLINNDKHPSV